MLALMETRTVILRNRDGKRMPATLRAPGNARGTFVVAHGVGGSRDQRVMRAIAGALAASGYASVAFDLADGANGPDADHSTATPSGHLADFEDAVAACRKAHWFVPPLCAGGHSLGGLLAAEYAVQDATVEQLLLVAPVISWRVYRWRRLIGLWWRLRRTVRLPVRALRHYPLPHAWLEDLRRFDGQASAARIGADTLVVAAGNDGLVGTEATHRSYAAAFPNARFVLLPGASHTFHPHEAALADTIRQWLT